MRSFELPLSLILCGIVSTCAIGCSDQDSATQPVTQETPQEISADAEAGTRTPRSGRTDPVAPGSWPAPELSVETAGQWTLRVRNGGYFTPGLANAYRERCYTNDDPTPECTALRSLVIADITLALEVIERSRDQRGTAPALAALELTEEPAILTRACRVLGQFPDTPGIPEAVLPLMLESAYLGVQQMASYVLASNSDPTLAAVGAYWGGNHHDLYVENEYQEYPGFAPHYSDMGFPEYPDAEWFSPADSDRSVGWWTEDDFATVSAWLTEELGTEGLTFRDWAQHLAQESQAMFQVDPDKQAEVQRLIEEWTKTQDMAVLEKMQKLQEELYAPAQAAGEIADKGVGAIGPPMTPEAQEQVRFYIAEVRAGHVARLVIAYPLTSLGRTVIQHAWNLTDYPGAWPPADESAAREE